MKLAIMQPYFMPYLGYFQLLQAADEFVLYDNVQFSKKGWFHRNRILMNGADEMFTVPLKKDSDYLDVRERELASDCTEQSRKILRKIAASYREAPFFREVMPLVQECFEPRSTDLFHFVNASLVLLTRFLGIRTPLIVSSSVDVDHTLRSQQRVLAICKHLKTDTYLNPIGGQSLYSAGAFKEEGIELRFLRTNPIVYQQYGGTFVPNLSIIDVLMFNSVSDIRLMLDQYDLV